ncbi:MAG TPA: HAMP domain-containing sensor histidine kinase [Candidatus Dormibacteraeota bacterium]|nr:HAMP domain-containing sensor histidine kinase [Candidatus Dormibacteraeota bacterium]
MSLRLRLAVFGAGVVAVALLVAGLLLYALLSRSALTTQDNTLRARADAAVTELNASGAVSAVPAVAPADLKTSNDVFVEVFDSGWSLLYTTAKPAVAPDRWPGFTTRAGVRLYSAPFNHGYVVAGQATRVPQESLAAVTAFLVISAVPALIAALLASWLVAGRALAPLKAVAVAAEDIGRTRDFGRRLPARRSRDEVSRLSAGFNGMLSRLQDAYESQRRFVADASHELRTPLTTIQGNAGLLTNRTVAEEVRTAAIADIAAESARMGRLVDRLLTLARAESGLELTLTRVDLRLLVYEVCRQASSAHPEVPLYVRGVTAFVDGDHDALHQLVWILLDNAFRYAHAAIEVRLFTELGWARLAVIDDGPGVPPEEREKIFDRFYRSDPSRQGSNAGLGLSIARWIVNQHHGRVTVGDASAAGGAAFLVDLPLLPRS